MISDLKSGQFVNVLSEVIRARRENYLTAFRREFEQERERHGGGSAEVKFEVENSLRAYGGMCCIDFVKIDGDDLVTGEMDITDQPCVEPISCEFGEVVVRIESLYWGAAHLHHDAVAIPQESICRWFDRWFDPENRRAAGREDSEFSGNIHQLEVQSGLISVDFGTAPADAMWDMLEFLRASGARHIRVTSADDWSTARWG